MCSPGRRGGLGAAVREVFSSARLGCVIISTARLRRRARRCHGVGPSGAWPTTAALVAWGPTLAREEALMLLWRLVAERAGLMRTRLRHKRRHIAAHVPRHQRPSAVA